MTAKDRQRAARQGRLVREYWDSYGRDDVEAAIRSIGLFRNKARHLIAMACLVTEVHGGRVLGPGR